MVQNGAGAIPVVLLVRERAVIPHVKVAQSADGIDRANVELRAFSTDTASAAGLFALPRGGVETLRPGATGAATR